MSDRPPELPAGRRGYLLLRRLGGVWGVANAEVTSLGRDERNGSGPGDRAGAAYRVGTAAGFLAADEILGVAAELDVRRPARAVARWWPAGSDGCAVWGGLTVVLIDPRHPPLALRLSGERAAGDPAAAAGAPGRAGNGTEGGASDGDRSAA